MMRRLAVVLAAACLLAGCGRYDDTTVPEAQPPSAAPAAPSTLKPCTNDGTEVSSYDPGDGPRDGPAVEKIRQRGRLVAGVAADTKLLGARDPSTGRLEGFDIDMALAIAEEIFPGDDPRTHVDFKVITAAQRIPLLKDGTLDIVARNMTVNCARWQEIAFSEIYYNSGQKVLVGKGSGITTVAEVAGKRICAPAGTTSLDNIEKVLKAVPVSSTDNAACMILFQNGEADGVSTDDTVLAGLAAQDPYADVLDSELLTREPYGIGVNKDSVELVRLINTVLEDMRRDGRWQRYYDETLGPFLPGRATQPKPVYGR